MTGTRADATRERLLALLTPVVEAEGHDLEDVVVTPAGRRRSLRVVVDRDGGIDLDGVADLARAVGMALDAADAEPDGGPLAGGAYVLEVTSPGVDRPLTLERHWRRATGRLVRAVLREGGEVTGRVTAVAGEAVTLDVDGTTRTLPLTDVARATVQVEFGRAPTSDGSEEQA